MSTPPIFDKTAASAMCGAYQHLCGTQISTPVGKEFVVHVAIAPHDDLNKWFFYNFYLENRDPQKALDFYNHNAYDVIVILRIQNDEGDFELNYQSLQHYLQRKHATRVLPSTQKAVLSQAH